MAEHGSYETYLTRMAVTGTWGDGPVLAAAVRLYKRPITIVPQNGRIFTVDAPNLPESAVSMYLGYAVTKFSTVNNHYVSLVKSEALQTEHSSDNTEESKDPQAPQPSSSSTTASASGN